jgi:hypothetical protein
MTRLDMDRELLNRICCGNAQAMDFLANQWSPYVHEIDDMMDGDRPAKRDQLKTFARAIALYSHPFYLANLAALKAVALVVTATYADVVEWEGSPDEWKRQYADHYRHCGMDMVLAVAAICGGHEHAFAISKEQREICYFDHHTRDGKPD